MLLDSPDPISRQCARTVEPAVVALLRLGITQEEVIDALSRALGIVRCVLDHRQAIQRRKLAALGRTLWTRMPTLPGLAPETASRVRTVIRECVKELKSLSEPAGPLFDCEEPVVSDAAPSPSEPSSPAASMVTESFASVSPPSSPVATAIAETQRPPSRPAALPQRSNGIRKPPFSRPRRAQGQGSLFDLLPSRPAQDDHEAGNGTSVTPSPAETAPSPDAASDAATTEAVPSTFTIASGEKGKAKDILAAVRILKTVDREQRPATTEEKQVLGLFAGFGPVALSLFPDPVRGTYKDELWKELGEELKALLTPVEYESAKRTTFNAFYTSPTVITAMHGALQRLGVPRDGLVLEPGCGIGNFVRLAPRGMRFIGIELDLVSGRIAQLLHADHDIRIENFRDTKIPEASLDAVVGNVPFADVKMEHRGQRYSLHDYFFAKSVDLLKPGGVLALVTSHFSLDKQNSAIREYLGKAADFVGAIRLPSDAFKREGTAVVTDIVFLRKRSEGAAASHAHAEWTGIAPLTIEGSDIWVNRYFHDRPEMVLGTWSRTDTLYGGEGYSVSGNGDLAGALAAAIGRLPEFSPPGRNGISEKLSPTLPRPPPHITEGSFVAGQDGVIRQCLSGKTDPVVYGGRTLQSRGTQTGRRFSALIRLRDLARHVLRSQNEDWPQEEREAARRDLSRAYDQFVFAYGPINKTTITGTPDGKVVRRMPNLVKFREDPDAMLVMSLEHYDEATGTATKAAIMTQDVVGRSRPITCVRSAEEGLLVSLNQRGAVDVPFIASLYGKPGDTVTEELGDLVYCEPGRGTWQTADQYLSGNVRMKLAAVLAAGPAYARNAQALDAVQPEDVLPGDIEANLGAPWIPESDIAAFAAELFNVGPGAFAIGHVKQEAAWSIDAHEAAEKSVAATSTFGTARANGTWLLELALNMKTPTIYDTVMNGGKEERIVNHEQTLAAREKQRQIKERFRAWAFADHERTERYVRLYNDNFNNIRLRRFDGSHLDFPGMNQTLQLRSHQRDAVWRCMTAGNTLLAQTVGAGKTYIMAATGMKMRQAGLIRKPLYVVPNHMLEQFGREFMQLYPNAKLLIAGKEDLSRDRRKHLTAKIASGDWDGIIVTHSSFERIGMSRSYQERFLREQIAEYQRLIIDHASTGSSRAQRNLIKTIEKQKAGREGRLKDLLAEKKKDDGLVFDELGTDYLFIDEAQYYKNLETPTKMERVAGIQTSGSERAFDLYMKARFLHERHPGRGMTFATGTPISNTMVEMYTLQRFLDPEGMQSRGIDHFDAWAATFGEVVDTMEISPDGKTLRPRSRFARFTNLPELQQMFRSFADVQTAQMLSLDRPDLEGGKPAVIACPMSEEQCGLQAELVDRYERLRTQKVDPRIDNALNITTDGRKLALDARLLSPEAQDFPDSKINALVRTVAGIWQKAAASRGTQMIFCDMGVHPTPWGFSAYEDIIGKLCAQGIPPGQIAVMGDADSDAKKQALFERVRSGTVRVLLGSTQKMGMGTNVQKRLVALHHLDAPWKPAEVEQREGRILRQGNDNKAVSIYRYVTQGSFDSYMWQALETKARFISQIMTGDYTARSAEDIGGHELSYAEVKAIASGNPAILTLAEADAELHRLGILKKNHGDEQYLARRRQRELPGLIRELTERLAGLTKDAATLHTTPPDPITIGGRRAKREDAIEILGGRLDSMPTLVRETRRVPLGVYRGLQFGLSLQTHGSSDVYLQGAAIRQTMLSREHQGPRAVLNALERLAAGYEAECERVGQDLAIAEGQLRDYEARLGVAFPHDAYVQELLSLRDLLKAALSRTEPPDDGEPTAADLAERIKVLKAPHTVADTSIQRIGRVRASVQEPITAQIRSRMERVPETGSQGEP